MKNSVNTRMLSALAAAVLMLGMPAKGAGGGALGPTPAEIAPQAQFAQINGLAVIGNRIVAVGDRGIVITSSDGKTWKQSTSPVDVLLNAVYFVDEKRGWAVGHDASILHTEDGGDSWTLQNWDAKDNRPFMDVLFLDERHGFAIGAYGLFKTTEDGGSTWSDFTDPAFKGGPHLNRLNRTANGQLVLVGEKGLVATSVDGKMWVVHPTGYEGSLFSVIPWGERGGVVVGMRGTMLEAADIGNPVWQKIETSTDKSLFGLADLGGGKVAASGYGGTILLLSPGLKPNTVAPVIDADVTQSSSIGGLAVWRNQLLAATNHGVKVINAQKLMPMWSDTAVR